MRCQIHNTIYFLFLSLTGVPFDVIRLIFSSEPVYCSEKFVMVAFIHSKATQIIVSR